ncbi:MAG: type I glyceraldehyde-3-phosphate dehydrogenase [Candidatus Ryanbacteria bacterium RIFCSPLOWO2_01_FULL_48_26]|uniref:Type I glyceraldehyde-3-phosphate dehydrogenase n=1 Tax=Candidatus Ryanbacteria bacterium RIFCSPLOWO2_01_FULL_48_26 TaxID=1802126 RepID=A0A1G2GRY7_9BACT|nr:MAG: type I glyceraldehyde-3-phosphate dehydrogenase [Candidatus Ryanbacteria bacterium RIFCSPLOWO2_01_FULL_48_26]
MAKKSSNKVRVAINGFGRIGRAFLKVAVQRPEIEVVAVNELGDIHNMAYLLKYDSVYGKSDLEISVDEKTPAIVVNGKKIKFVSEKEPLKLPWKDLAVDVVVESTGLFTSYEKAKVHLDAGARRVVISAPAKDESGSVTYGETVLLGVNDEKLKNCQISSNASCTTNAGSPLVAILDEKIGIEKAILNTVHAYTASQAIVDAPNKKDFREGRAGAQNIVPSSTGAAIATTKAYPALAGKFDGISIRVPVVAGSIVDVTFIAKRGTSKEEVNKILKTAAGSARWKDIFTVTEEPLVSRDILGNHYASIADLALTRVVDGNLVKVLAWYDNEMGYTYTLVDHVIKAGKIGK